MLSIYWYIKVSKPTILYCSFNGGHSIVKFKISILDIPGIILLAKNCKYGTFYSKKYFTNDDDIKSESIAIICLAICAFS